VNPVSAVEVDAEAITVAEQATSLTMSPDHLKEDTGPAPRNRRRAVLHPRCSAVEKKVMNAIYSSILELLSLDIDTWLSLVTCVILV
jgi:hypothetical protein